MKKQRLMMAIVERDDVAMFKVGLAKLLDHDVNHRFYVVALPDAPRLCGVFTSASTPLLAYALQNGASKIALSLAENKRVDVMARVEHELITAFSRDSTKGSDMYELAKNGGDKMASVATVLYGRRVESRGHQYGHFEA
jgi:hypothetical protein